MGETVSFLNLIVDRKREMSILMEMLECNREQRIFSICDEGGKGKTFLLRAFHQHCRKLKVPSSFIEFASTGRVSAAACMRNIVEGLGEEYFSSFCQRDFELHRLQSVVQIGGGKSDSDVSFDGQFDRSEVSEVAGRDYISYWLK
jgi:hypothetical protein